MRHKIFLVHGMGVYDGDEWKKEIEVVLRGVYAAYPLLSAIDFDDRYELEMIHYDPIFQEIVSKWQADAQEILPLAEDVGATEVGSLVGWLTTAGKTDGNFIWSHCADVLLYRLSATVRERVKTHVAKQIAAGVNAQYQESQESLWSVVAHSLGTCVAHDALDMLATGDVPTTQTSAFDPTIEQAQVVAMIANTSRVLETVVDVFQSTVKPGMAGQAGRACLRFLNMRHFLDPFTIPRMFHPQDWPDATTANAGRYLYTEVTHIHQANVHDVCHYLKNPAVHIPLFRALSGETRITKAQEKTAIASFKQLDDLTEQVAAEIKSELAAVTPSIGAEWATLRTIWDGFHGVLQARGEE